MNVDKKKLHASPSKQKGARKVISKQSTVPTPTDNDSGQSRAEYQAMSENLHLQKKKFKKMKKGLSKPNSQPETSSAVTSVKLLNKETEDLAPTATIRDMCEIIAGDFYETAWDVCSTRFYFEGGSETIIYDLRDSWLSIIEMEFLDSDPDIIEQINIPEQMDVPPLPPKFDTWAHGALEVLPNRYRESIMDPFLREPQAWILEMVSGMNNDLLRRAPAYSVDSWNDLDDNEEDEEEDEDEQQNYYSHFSANKLKVKTGKKELDLHLKRPTSPVSSDYSIGNRLPATEPTWSTTTTAGGSFIDDEIEIDITAPEESRTLLESPLSAGIMASISRKSLSDQSEPLPETPAPSLELLYPSMLSRIPEIKASSEMVYSMGGFGGIPEIGRSSQMIAFKLPGQSSSDAVKISKHVRRKSKEAAASFAAVNNRASGKITSIDLSNNASKQSLKLDKRSMKSNPEMLLTGELTTKESCIRRNVITATAISGDCRENFLETEEKSKNRSLKKIKSKGVRVDNASNA